jgi:hypothetical protein
MKDIPAFAFPIHPDVDLNRDQIWGGMTLRDYFAAHAMQAILTRNDNRFTTTLEWVGGKAYQYADAMMKAREV